jgi:hypothetical protein
MRWRDIYDRYPLAAAISFSLEDAGDFPEHADTRLNPKYVKHLDEYETALAHAVARTPTIPPEDSAVRDAIAQLIHDYPAIGAYFDIREHLLFSEYAIELRLYDSIFIPADYGIAWKKWLGRIEHTLHAIEVAQQARAVLHALPQPIAEKIEKHLHPLLLG